MIAKVLLAFTVLAVAFVAYSEVNAQTYKYCERKETQVSTWDACNANTLGKRKSISVCYFASRNNRYVYRYDYYTCRKQQLGSNVFYFIIPGNCTGAQSPIMAEDGFYDVFNRYDDATKRCSLTPPPPPTEAPTEAPTETTEGVTGFGDY